MTIRAVVFDVGETLVDETRIWESWAAWLGVPRMTFLAVLGAGIARGDDHRDPIRLFRPGVDIHDEVEARKAAGIPDDILPTDLYPDAVSSIEALIAAGYRVGIVGNQPRRAETTFLALNLPLDFVASSDSWGVQKPDPAFFGRIASELGLSPADIAYVGDRVDNDVEPAAAAGMAAIFVRRGPWAWIQAGREDPLRAAATIDRLDTLPELLRAL